MFRLLIILVVILAVVGFWRGWFTVARGPALDNKEHISVTIDKDQIKRDINKGEQKLNDKLSPKPAAQ